MPPIIYYNQAMENFNKFLIPGVHKDQKKQSIKIADPIVANTHTQNRL